MYERDQSAIAAFVNVGVYGWEDRAGAVALAAAFTMQTQTPSVLGFLRQFAAGDGPATLLWGNRGRVYDAFMDGTLQSAMRRAQHTLATGHDDTPTLARAMLEIMDVPGLAYVKAGFVMQMIWGKIGCIDTKNRQRYGADVYAPQARDGGRQRHNRFLVAARYIDCIRTGMATHFPGADACSILWDEWCHEQVTIDAARRAMWPTADDLSREHVEWVRLAYHGLMRSKGARNV